VGADAAERDGLIGRQLRCLVVALAPVWAPALAQAVQGIGPQGPVQGPYVSVFNVKALPVGLGVVNAKGDGVTDDTGPIQAALNAAGACFTMAGCERYPGLSSGAVYLPPGQYGITKTLTIPNQVRLYGAGRTTSEIVALNPGWTNPTPNALVRLGPGNQAVFNTRVEYLDINAQGLANTIDLYGADLQDLSGAEHVLLRAFGAAAVQITGGTGTPATSNGYILLDVEAFNGIAGTGIAFDLDGGTGGATFSPTLVGLIPSNAAFLSNAAPACIRLQRGTFHLFNVMPEYCTEAVQFGGPSGTASGEVHGLNGNHDTDALFVTANSNGVSAYGITNFGGTNLVNDATGRVIIPVAGNNYQAAYITGANEYPTVLSGIVQGRVALTYGATVRVPVKGTNFFTLAVTNTSAFTISAPSTYSPTSGSALSQYISIDIFNTSGGVMGAVTWTGGALGYRLAGAFVPPATGNHRIYTFYYDGAVWREISRSAADIPN